MGECSKLVGDPAWLRPKPQDITALPQTIYSANMREGRSRGGEKRGGSEIGGRFASLAFGDGRPTFCLY